MADDIWARVDEAIDTDPLQLRDIVAELLRRAETAEAALADHANSHASSHGGEQGDLRDRLIEALNTTLTTPDGGIETATAKWDRHDRHNFLHNCAACRGDVPAMVDALWPVIGPLLADRDDELERLRGEVDRLTDFGLDSRDRHQAEFEQLRGKLAEAKADSDNLRKRLHHANTAAVKAEAEAAQLRVFVERMPDQHMRFGIVGQDATEMVCADWCYACKLERAEAERDELRAAATAAFKRLHALNLFGSSGQEFTDRIHREVLAILNATLDARTSGDAEEDGRVHRAR